jgi:hypothetical protein
MPPRPAEAAQADTAGAEPPATPDEEVPVVNKQMEALLHSLVRASCSGRLGLPRRPGMHVRLRTGLLQFLRPLAASGSLTPEVLDRTARPALIDTQMTASLSAPARRAFVSYGPPATDRKVRPDVHLLSFTQRVHQQWPLTTFSNSHKASMSIGR